MKKICQIHTKKVKTADRKVIINNSRSGEKNHLRNKLRLNSEEVLRYQNPKDTKEKCKKKKDFCIVYF
jgi:hypothetical protein